MAPSQRSDQKGKMWDDPTLAGEHSEPLDSLACIENTATFRGGGSQSLAGLGLIGFKCCS